MGMCAACVLVGSMAAASKIDQQLTGYLEKPHTVCCGEREDFAGIDASQELHVSINKLR